MSKTKEQIIEEYVKRGKKIRQTVPINIAYGDDGSDVYELDLDVEVEENALKVYDISSKRQKQVFASITLCIFKQLSKHSKEQDSPLNLHGIKLIKRDNGRYSLYASVSHFFKTIT
mgnify:CR=1 FL=1